MTNAYHLIKKAQERQAQNERMERELQRIERQRQYDLCISSAYQAYSGNWDGACEIQGKEADCTLPRYVADGIDERHAESQERCVALYKSN